MWYERPHPLWYKPSVTTHSPTEFVLLKAAAARLGLRESWLKEQVGAGVVPAIADGRDILVHPDDVRDALRDLAKKNPAAKPEGGDA